MHKVTGNSQQAPQYEAIRESGDDGGDFVFVRKPSKQDR
jgi:hypothetical protein